MSDLKTAIIDAKYIDLMDLSGALAAEFSDGLDAERASGPIEQAVAAAIFRWAADQYEEAAQ